MPRTGVSEVGAASRRRGLFIEARDVDVRKGELRGTAVFEVRDRRIAAFEVVPAD